MTTESTPDIVSERHGGIGLITLNRPQAMNALSLPMVRAISATLGAWCDDPTLQAVVFRGAQREGRTPAFCAGGDIRFFHQAACAADPALDAFFTEEYALDHLIHRYPKPTLALMDGIVMGGGMGIAQGCSLRIATERARLAMPETLIGLFPDVGGGWFLSRCPGSVGEYLGLTGQTIGARRAIDWGLADCHVPVAVLPALLEALMVAADGDAVGAVVAAFTREAAAVADAIDTAAIERCFSQPSVGAIEASLASEVGAWAGATLAALQQRSPLMRLVTLELIRRARSMTLADELRLERDLVHHCFHQGAAGEGDAVEGIRALAIDKDHRPRWADASVAAVDPRRVAAFFVSPWGPRDHPLRSLGTASGSRPSPGPARPLP